MEKQVIETLTATRVDLDGITQMVVKLPRSRYVALAATALELGRMYLGEIALDLGKEYPYEKTKEATSPEMIQKAVDLYEGKIDINSNEIQAIITLRETIDNLSITAIKTIRSYRKNKNAPDNFVNDCNISEAYRSLKESRMWLGKRLGEIRDNATK